jgi:uncharacterized protein YegJ (DUF2314 family)
MRAVFVFVLLIVSTAVLAQRRDENEVIGVPKQDAEMAAAIAKAQSMLEEFLSVWRARPAGTSDFRLKVRLTEGGVSEHFWVQPFRTAGNGFEGKLANEPRMVKSVRNGQQISFNRAEVSDWGYFRNGKQVGSFTVCAMMRHAPKDQSDYHRNTYGFQC